MKKKPTINKKFITNKLIPFILREGGRGYDQGAWIEDTPEGASGTYYNYAMGRHLASPTCGTAACIGGSVAILCGRKNRDTWAKEGRELGLSRAQTDRLFTGDPDEWPEPFSTRFRERKSPFGKAKVAVALLEAIIKTNGAVLDD